MKILFSNLFYQDKVECTSLISIVPPLDLAYCAALLRRDVPESHVTILDANALHVSVKSHIKMIKDYMPDVLIFSVQTHSINTLVHICQALNDLHVCTILIGTHGAALIHETFSMIPSLNVIVHDEPEYPVRDIIVAIRDNKNFVSVCGVAFRDGDTIHINKKSTNSFDIDLLPFPARDLLPNHKYSSPYASGVTSIQTTRGCPGRCSFCDSHVVYGRPYRSRSAENVVAEILQCIEEYNVHYFAIIDHTFTVNASFVESVCALIINKGIHNKIQWVCNTRVDMLCDTTLRLMRKAGCLQIGVGIESGITDHLNDIKKTVTSEQIIDAICRIKRHGIIVMGYAIVGFPFDSLASIDATERAIRKLNPHILQLSFATPLPGTKLYELCVNEKLLVSTNWDDYTFLNKSVILNPMISVDVLLRKRNSIVKHFYLRPSKLWELTYFLLFKVRVNYVCVGRTALKILRTLSAF